MAHKTLKSWKKVFSHKAELITANNVSELNSILDKYPSAKVSGSFHSYNRVALADTVVILGGDFLGVNRVAENKYFVGAAAKVEDVIAVLLKDKKRLINKGNFDKQTLVGAAKTGTHGFGKSATIMDSVESLTVLSGDKVYPQDLNDEHIILGLVIKVAPLVSYSVHQKAMKLSDVVRNQLGGNRARAYAVLPYSHDTDPICLVAEYTPLDYEHVINKTLGKVTHTKPPMKLRLWWKLDRWFPPIRKWLQKCVAYNFRLDNVILTDINDVDSMYDPNYGIAGKTTWDARMWAYRPTYTCYNISLFVKPEDTESFIKHAIKYGEQLKGGLFRCMIGVRELTDTSVYNKAGNYDGPRNAVDLYCTAGKKNAEAMILLQTILESTFDLRLHQGKAVLNTYGIHTGELDMFAK